MARSTQIIQSPYLQDVVVNGVSTPGLLTLVNAYLASLVNPIVIEWSLDIRMLMKRFSPQWMFTITTDTGGPTLATPFTLTVVQDVRADLLMATVDALYLANPTEFFSAPVFTKLDSDATNFARQYAVSCLRNISAAAAQNYTVANGNLNGQELYNFRAKVVTLVGATPALTASMTGLVLISDSAVPVTLAMPNDLPQGFTVTIIQMGAGQITVDPDVGATLNNRSGFDSTFAQYAAVSLVVVSNVDGVSAVAVLAGDAA